MNLAALRTDLYDRLSYTSVPSQPIIDRLTRFMNQTHRQLLSEKGLTKLRRHTLLAACVANSPYMTLPQAMTRVIIVTDRLNRWALDDISLQTSRRSDPGLSQVVAFPTAYYVDSLSAVTAQDPAAACQPFVVSDNAADGALKRVYIEGVITGGYYRSAFVNLNGVTPVAIDALATWTYFSKFYFQNADGTTATPTGNITLTDASGGNELARITPGHFYPRYTRLGLYGVPTQVNTYYVDGDLHIEDMAQADDEPMLPEDWHWLLVSGALQKEYKKRERMDLYGAELKEYNDGKASLKMHIAPTSGVARNPQTRLGFSQLGPNYPSGS